MQKRNAHRTGLAVIAAWLLCFLFVVQIANRGVYLHTHVLKNGLVVSHAHPFSKSSDSAPVKQHHHSNFEYTFWGQFNLLFFVALAIALIIGIAKLFKYSDIRIDKSSSGFLYSYLGRAPPVLS